MENSVWPRAFLFLLILRFLSAALNILHSGRLYQDLFLGILQCVFTLDTYVPQKGAGALGQPASKLVCLCDISASAFEKASCFQNCVCFTRYLSWSFEILPDCSHLNCSKSPQPLSQAMWGRFIIRIPKCEDCKQLPSQKAQHISLPHLGNTNVTKEDFPSCIETKNIISTCVCVGGRRQSFNGIQCTLSWFGRFGHCNWHLQFMTRLSRPLSKAQRIQAPCNDLITLCWVHGGSRI